MDWIGLDWIGFAKGGFVNHGFVNGGFVKHGFVKGLGDPGAVSGAEDKVKTGGKKFDEQKFYKSMFYKSNQIQSMFYNMWHDVRNGKLCEIRYVAIN